jgi:hypothetical protein
MRHNKLGISHTIPKSDNNFNNLLLKFSLLFLESSEDRRKKAKNIFLSHQVGIPKVEINQL